MILKKLPVVVAVDSKVRRTQEASDLAQVEAGLDFAEACLDLHTARNHSYHLPAVRDTQDALGEHLVELAEEELEACLAVGLEAFQACLALPDQVPCPEQAAQGSFHGSWGWVVSLAVRWQGSGRVSAGDQPVIGELVAGALQGNLRLNKKYWIIFITLKYTVVKKINQINFYFTNQRLALQV